MRISLGWLAAVSLAAAPALAQEAGTSTTTRETTVQTSDGKTVTYTGTVVEYVPRKTIVLRDSSSKLVTYKLAADVVLPGDIQVGKTVSLSAEPGPDGAIVRKVTTTSVTPEGNLKTTTRTTETAADGTTTTTEESKVEGVLSAYEPNKMVTLTRPDGSSVTYVIDRSSVIPTDLVVGKHIALQVSAAGQPRVIRKITYTTVTHN